ncbi:MAG: hypothetical protein FWF44_01890 [Defluviitaleaceae bacterium]|nr:hypothetical protein [Defluviitaleaceae bacterium]
MPPNDGFPAAEADKGLVLHERLRIGGAEIMAADSAGCNAPGENMYTKLDVYGNKAGKLKEPGAEYVPGSLFMLAAIIYKPYGCRIGLMCI